MYSNIFTIVSAQLHMPIVSITPFNSLELRTIHIDFPIKIEMVLTNNP